MLNIKKTGSITNDISMSFTVYNKNKIQTVLYGDDQILIIKSEDELHIAVNELNKIGKKYDMKISTSKTKSMGLCGKYTESKLLLMTKL
jgi:hypothetical protein